MSRDGIYPRNNISLVYTYECILNKLGAETPKEVMDLKHLEKDFKKRLNEIEVDKEMLEKQLKSKNKEISQLQMQYRDKEEHYDKLEQEKRSLERQLEIDAIKTYDLIREVDNLKCAKRKLEIYIDHLEMKD